MRTNTRLYPASTLSITNPDGPTVESDLVQCVHCGLHFPVRIGSGKTRGFCTLCNGPVCGQACAECVPLEQWIENRETQMPDDHKPVRVSRGGIVLPYDVS